ncbi:STAS domain-containing protein, partial [Bacillus sp. WP8]|uniref:STAS domain-containing protein n=1 Tax=Bacillus sp. WP8 TaxID=756828 RepID=UPI0011A91DC3
EMCVKDVRYMDSRGLGVLVGVFKGGEKGGGRLKVEKLSEGVVRLFEMSGLKEMIEICGK